MPAMLRRALDWLATPAALRRLGVAFCVVVAAGAVAIRYPAAVSDAHDLVARNAGFDFADRDIAGGNSIVADQAAMYQVRSWVPRDGMYRVVTGARKPIFRDFTIPWISTFARSYLLPRRQSESAPWILCYGCDRARFPGGAVVWDDGEGISLIRARS